MKKKLRKRDVSSKPKEVSLLQVKETLTEKIIEKYGSINAFVSTDDANNLGLDKSVSTILTPNGRNSLVVLNILLDFFDLPQIKKKVSVVRTVNYFTD